MCRLYTILLYKLIDKYNEEFQEVPKPYTHRSIYPIPRGRANDQERPQTEHVTVQTKKPSVPTSRQFFTGAG